MPQLIYGVWDNVVYDNRGTAAPTAPEDLQRHGPGDAAGRTHDRGTRPSACRTKRGRALPSGGSGHGRAHSGRAGAHHRRPGRSACARPHDGRPCSRSSGAHHGRSGAGAARADNGRSGTGHAGMQSWRSCTGGFYSGRRRPVPGSNHARSRGPVRRGRGKHAVWPRRRRGNDAGLLRAAAARGRSATCRSSPARRIRLCRR